MKDYVLKTARANDVLPIGEIVTEIIQLFFRMDLFILALNIKIQMIISFVYSSLAIKSYKYCDILRLYTNL